MPLVAQTDQALCAQGEGKIDYDEFVAVICKSWERAEQTERLSKWLYANYVRIEPIDKKFKEIDIKIFQTKKEPGCFGLCKGRDSGVSQAKSTVLSCFDRTLSLQLYDDYLETGGPGGDALPPAVMATALIQNHDKFCGLLNSLGEQSFAEDKDMSNRVSIQRKNEMLSARKFATDDNKVLKGLQKYQGGEERLLLAKDDLKRTGRYAATLRRYTCASQS